jgi:hypothetical protein
MERPSERGALRAQRLDGSCELTLPPLDDRAFYTAYEIRAGAKMIRAYAAVSESWHSDNDIGRWLGYGTAITGVALLFDAFLEMDTTASSLARERG